jgi:hypothetical protein
MVEESHMSGLRQRAWWILVAFAGAIVIFGAQDVVFGAAADRAIALGLTGRTHEELLAGSADTYRMYDFTARTQASTLVAAGVLLLGVLLVPYRRGERWAWRLMWVLPVWALSVPAMYLIYGLVPDAPPPPPLISGAIFGGLAIVVLFADHRRFAVV